MQTMNKHVHTNEPLNRTRRKSCMPIMIMHGYIQLPCPITTDTLRLDGEINISSGNLFFSSFSDSMSAPCSESKKKDVIV